jgi:hypothetical protein
MNVANVVPSSSGSPAVHSFVDARLRGADEVNRRFGEAVEGAPATRFGDAPRPITLRRADRKGSATGLASKPLLEAGERVVKGYARVVDQVRREQAHLLRHRLLDDERRHHQPARFRWRMEADAVGSCIGVLW